MAQSPTKLKNVLDLSSPHMLLALVRRRQDEHRTVESVTTLYVLDHKTSVGITLHNHYFGDSAKIDELFAIREPCISALHRDVSLLQPVEQGNGCAKKLYRKNREYRKNESPISDLMKDIKGQEHTVLGIDPDYPGTEVADDEKRSTLWVSFSDAVTLSLNIHIQRSNLKMLYRSAHESPLTPGSLGLPLDPIWTVGHPKGISMNESQVNKFVSDLLDWQNEPPYAVRKATSKAAMVTPVKKATSNAAKVTPVKQAKSKPTKGNPKATRKPTFHTFHLRFTH